MSHVCAAVAETLQDYGFMIEECGIDEVDLDLNYKLIDANISESPAEIDLFFTQLDAQIAPEQRPRCRFHLCSNNLIHIPDSLKNVGLLSRVERILLCGNSITRLEVAWLVAAPLVVEISAEANEKLLSVSQDFLVSAQQRGCALKLFGCDALTEPLFTVTACERRNQNADISAMIKWYSDNEQAVSVPECPAGRFDQMLRSAAAEAAQSVGNGCTAHGLPHQLKHARMEASKSVQAEDVTFDTSARLSCSAQLQGADGVVTADCRQLGYYPHLSLQGQVVLDAAQARDALTLRMIELASIRHCSQVLDLGCGNGLACVQIAKQTGAACTGVDSIASHVEQSHRLSSERHDLNLDFFEGSCTALPSEVTAKRYSHILSRSAWCYSPERLAVVLAQIASLLKPGGVMVLSSYVGCDRPVSEETLTTVYKRHNIVTLLGHKAWRMAVDQAGLCLEHFENLDKHMAQTYLDLHDEALETNSIGSDGVPKAIQYAASLKAVQKKEIGMNLALLSLENERYSD